MSEDKCRPVEVDGETIRVHGDGEMDATDREMFADVVRAAKRRLRADCLHLHQTDAADFEHDPLLLPVWVCDDCGQAMSP